MEASQNLAEVKEKFNVLKCLRALNYNKDIAHLILQLHIDEKICPSDDEEFNQLCRNLQWKLPGIEISTQNLTIPSIADALQSNRFITNLKFRWNLSLMQREWAVKIPKFAEALKANSTLSILSIVHSHFGKDGALVIADMLKSPNSKLKELDIQGNNICDDGMVYIARALEKNSSLVRLNVGNNNIREIGGCAIGKMLRVNSSLQELYLFGNHIGDGTRDIAHSLKSNSSLRKLNLLGSDINEDQGCSIAEALKENSGLKTLNLWGNQIKSGARAFGESLKINRSLRGLSLSENEIEGDVVEISEALKINTTLTRLDLSENSITRDGIANIANALKENHWLSELNLAEMWEGLDDEAALQISDMLKINSSLAFLNLRFNRIGLDGIYELLKAVRFNCSLTKLDLYPHERQYADEFEKQLEINSQKSVKESEKRKRKLEISDNFKAKRLK